MRGRIRLVFQLTTQISSAESFSDRYRVNRHWFPSAPLYFGALEQCQHVHPHFKKRVAQPGDELGESRGFIRVLWAEMNKAKSRERGCSCRVSTEPNIRSVG